jgi:glycosyltransferase involved in cell wall biosynthesis
MIIPQTEVDVLLATFNGEKHLVDFLESLKKQTGVTINLKVGDDKSDDGTLEILNAYRHSFQTFELYDGPGQGPARNFLNLLHYSNANYVAFADQDDIWENDHLSNSILRLKKSIGPTMTFTSVREFDDRDPNYKRVWPRYFSQKSVANIVFQNYARGCVMVLNSSARDLINSKKPDFLIMHDWWVLLVLSCCGNVIFSEIPEINYRRHAGNFTSTKSRPSWSFFVALRSGVWKPAGQLECLLQCFEDKMTQITRKKIYEIIYITRHPLSAIRYSLFSKDRHRESYSSEMKLRLGLPFLLMLTRNNDKHLRNIMN